MESPLEDRPAYMNKRTMEESRSTIDSYDSTEGATRRVTRGARGLSLQVPPRKVDRGAEMRQGGREHMLLAGLSEALSILAI